MILDNPFHVLGLLADCSTRKKSQRVARAKAYLSVGKPLVFPTDLYFQGCRRNQATVDRAVARLHDAQDRIGYGLFWFTEGSVPDGYALSLLRKHDLLGALDIWERIEHRDPTRSYASSLNNLGTICLLIALSGPSAGKHWPPGSRERVSYLERGLAAKARLVGMLSAPDLADFCRTFSDDLAVRDSNMIAKAFEQSFFETIAEAEKYGIDVPSEMIVSILKSGGPRTAQLTEKLVLGVRNELQRAITTCAKAYEHDPSKAAAAGEQLMNVAREKLAEFAALVPRTNITYTSIADQTAEAILDADVADFNWRIETGEISLKAMNTSLVLAEYAAEIACGAAIRQRARENVETTQEIIADRKRTAAVAGLQEKINKWFARARVIEETSPRQRLEFAERALKRSGGAPTSALELIGALRRQGIADLGASFPRSEQMVVLGSAVCTVLANCIISAYNDSVQPSEDARAVRILQSLPTHFQAVSGVGSGGVRFFVTEQCFRHLMNNIQISEHNVSVQETQGSQGFQSSSGRGCALAILGGIVAVVVLVLATDGDSGPLEFQMPPVATGRVLSMPELRWCVREDRQIERDRRVRATSQADLDRFNGRVDNYNSRCGGNSYSSRDMVRARREVGARGR